jgi:hypothetical protein
MTPRFPLGPASGPIRSPEATPGAWINVCTPTPRCSRTGTFFSGKALAWAGNISAGTWMPGIRTSESAKRVSATTCEQPAAPISSVAIASVKRSEDLNSSAFVRNIGRRSATLPHHVQIVSEERGDFSGSFCFGFTAARRCTLELLGSDVCEHKVGRRDRSSILGNSHLESLHALVGTMHGSGLRGAGNGVSGLFIAPAGGADVARRKRHGAGVERPIVLLGDAGTRSLRAWRVTRPAPAEGGMRTDSPRKTKLAHVPGWPLVAVAQGVRAARCARHLERRPMLSTGIAS